jgi:L-seryl-tRNA(Ser) seleniumtransferase
VLAMLSETAAAVQRRAESVAAALRQRGIEVQVVPSAASVGGGAFPTAKIPSSAVAITTDAQRMEERLRRGDLPVIGRLSEGKLLLDLRSVLPSEDAPLTQAIVRAQA